MPIAEVNGQRLYYEDTGGVGPAVIFSHGLFMDHEMFAPQVEALRIKRAVQHPRLGEIDLIAQPCEITGFDRALRTVTPELGEHNEEILQSLGYDEEAIEKLKVARAI